jgi:hypothetical protein
MHGHIKVKFFPFRVLFEIIMGQYFVLGTGSTLTEIKSIRSLSYSSYLKQIIRHKSGLLSKLLVSTFYSIYATYSDQNIGGFFIISSQHTNIVSANQDILCLQLSSQCSQEPPTIKPIISQVNPAHHLSNYLFNTHLKAIHSTTPRISHWNFPTGFLIKSLSIWHISLSYCILLLSTLNVN